MDEPILAEIAHPYLGELKLILSTYHLTVGATGKRIPYLWLGREDGEVIATLTKIIEVDREANIKIPPNHSWVVLRPPIRGLRELILESGVISDTGIRYHRHSPPAELWEYTLSPPKETPS